MSLSSTKLAELADNPAIVTATYLLVFVPWTAVASLDFISAHWKSVRDSRHDAQYHLFFAIAPTFIIFFYIFLQFAAEDYKEMAAAIVALIFSLHHVARTVWAIAQLNTFRSWAANSILALREHGIEYQCDCKSDDPWEIADSLLVNDQVVDNQLMHGEPRCYLRFGDRLNTPASGNSKLHGPKRILNHLGAQLGNLCRVLLFSLQIVFHLALSAVGLQHNVASKTFAVHQVPYEPISLWLTWATVFVAQGLPQWLSSFKVAMQNIDDMDEDGGKKTSDEISESFASRRDFFAGEVFASAVLHTSPPTSKANETSYPNPFTLLDWDSSTNTHRGRLTKQDLLKHVLCDGRALPFETPHSHARTQSGKYGYADYSIKLQRVAEGMPDKFGTEVLNFDVNRLEWLAILLHLGLKSLDYNNSEEKTQSPPQPKGQKDVDKSRNDLDDAAYNDNAIRNLYQQLGFRKFDEETFTQTLSKFETLLAFPLKQSHFTRPSKHNRLVLQCSEYVDGWLALNAGEDIRYLQENDKHWRELYHPLCKKQWKLELKGFYDSFSSLREFHKVMEIQRLDFQFARAHHDHQHLDNSLTFMGYNMELVRTALAVSISRHGTAFVDDDEKWKIAPATQRKYTSIGMLSETLSDELRTVDPDHTTGVTYVKVCLLVEIQRLCHETWLSTFDPQLLVMLAILSFSSVSVELEKEESTSKSSVATGVVSKLSTSAITIPISEDDPRNQNLKAKFVARGAPQEISVEVKLSVRSDEREFRTKTTLVGKGGTVFQWQDWRDAFSARLEGHSKWQVGHQLPTTSVTWAEVPINQAIRQVHTPMSGSGDYFQTWDGWKPFRSEFAIFELRSPEFLLQVSNTKTFYYEHYSWLDNEIGIADYMRESREPIPYEEARKDILRHAALIVKEHLVHGNQEAFLQSMGSEAGNTEHVIENENTGGNESMLLDEAEALLTSGAMDRAIFLLEIGATELGMVSALDRCINLLLGDEPEIAPPSTIRRATSIIRRYLTFVEGQPCRTVDEIGLRMERLEDAVPIFQVLVNLDNLTLQVLPHFVSFIRMVPSYWSSEERVEQLRCKLRRAFLFYHDVRLLSDLASISFQKQRTFARLKDTEDYTTRHVDELGVPFAVVNIHRTSRYFPWREESGMILKKLYLNRVYAEYNWAEHNEGNALISLAHLYRDGPCWMEKDWALAEEIYQKVLDMEFRPDAMYFLGCMYKDGGHGLEKDVERALDCFRRAKTESYYDRPAAAVEILTLQQKQSTPEEVKKRVETLKQLAENSKVTTVVRNVAKVITFGAFGNEPDLVKGKELYIRAMELGDMDASSKLVDHFYEHGIDDNLLAAANQCARAVVEKQDITAMLELGHMLRSGNGVKKDIQLAADLYETALQGGDSSGAQNLAVIYSMSDEVKKDPDDAITLLRGVLKEEFSADVCNTLGSIIVNNRQGADRLEGIELLERVIRESTRVKPLYALAMALKDEKHPETFNGQRAHELCETLIERVSVIEPVLTTADPGNGFRALTVWEEHNRSTVNTSLNEMTYLWEVATSVVYPTALWEVAVNYKTGRYGIDKNEEKAERMWRCLQQHAKWCPWVMKFEISSIILDGKHGFAGDKDFALGLRYQGAAHSFDADFKFMAANSFISPPFNTERRHVEKGVALLESIVSEATGSYMLAENAACYALSNVFLEGTGGIEMDPRRGRELLELSIERGNNQNAMNTLAKHLLHGLHGIERDDAAAEALLQRSVERDEVPLLTKSALSYQTVILTRRMSSVSDIEKAITLCQRIIADYPCNDIFSVNSIYMYASFSLIGLGNTEVSTERALRLLEDCVESCDNLGLTRDIRFQLAALLVIGPRGVERDEERALRLLLEGENTSEETIPKLTVSMAPELVESVDLTNDISDSWTATARPEEGPLDCSVLEIILQYSARQ